MSRPSGDLVEALAADQSVRHGMRRRGLLRLAVLVAFLVSPPVISGVQLTLRYRSLDLFLVWSVAMSLIWVALLHMLVRRALWLHLALLPLYLTTAADLFVMHHFGARLTSSYLSIIITERADIGEFAHAYAPSIAVTLAMLALLCVVGFGGIRAVRVKAPAWITAATATALLLGYAAPFVRQVRTMPFGRALVDVAAHDSSTPIGTVVQTAVTLVHLRETQRSMAEREAFTFGAKRGPSAEGQEEIFVIVIGESARSDRWSLNGYERETNPRLRAVPNLVSFNDYVASAAHTAVAVPAMLSLAPITSWRDIESQRSIVSAFREVGFDTRWLSTQEVDAWGGIINRLAAEADGQRYFSRALDDVLVDALAGVLADPNRGKKLLVVLHPRGNHFGTTKYPPEFAKYPEGEGDRRQRMNNAYDNGILFTDFVLSKVIEIVRERHARSAVFYASDHGENLLDVDGLYGHGIGNRYDLSSAAIVWCSEELAEANTQAMAAARAHAASSIGHGNLAHSILDLARIEVPGLDGSKSIFSDHFREAPRYFIARGELREYRQERGAAPAAPERRSAPTLGIAPATATAH